MFTDYAAIKYLFSKQDAKPRLIRWILLLQEFDIKIKNKLGAENVAGDHLSRLKKPNLKELKDEEINDKFPDEFLMSIKDEEESMWFADFANYLVRGILRKGLTYAQRSTPYHPQTSGQVENTNRALKRILKKTVKDNPSVWLRKLDDALWAFRTAYKTPIGTTPYRIYGKTYHLPFEIEYRAYWALQSCNPDLKVVGEKQFLQLHKLDELRLQAYENSKLYKARTKAYHDKKLRVRKEFKTGDKVLMYNSKYKFKAPKLRSKWYGPFIVKHTCITNMKEASLLTDTVLNSTTMRSS
nr:hypothetical protein [Tanacetum cinerariifolium]